MTKVFEYVIDLSPEDAWEKTLQFWNLRKGRVRYHIGDNFFFIDHGISISGCSACSYGEKYQMNHIYRILICSKYHNILATSLVVFRFFCDPQSHPTIILPIKIFLY